MKIAIAKEGNFVSGHFGHCEGFEIVDIEGNEIKGREFLKNPGHRPGFLPNYLADNNVNIIISGGMGASAQNIFKNRNIEVIVGARGDLEKVINDYIDGRLESTNSVCREHAHHDECESHR